MRERERERAYGFGLSGEYKVGCNFHRQKVRDSNDSALSLTLIQIYK